MTKYQKIFLVVVVLAIAAGVICAMVPMTKGLDIAGGIRVVLQTDPQRAQDWSALTPDKRNEKMASMRKTIMTRVMGMKGVAMPIVRVQPPNRLVVELPGVKNQEQALDTIKGTAALEFYWLRDVSNANNPTGRWSMQQGSATDGSKNVVFVDNSNGITLDSSKAKDQKAVLEQVVNIKNNEPILTGKDLLSNASADYDQQDGVVIRVQFNNEGTQIFKKFTARHQGDYLAIFFDGKLLTAPEIRDLIPNGNAQISGFKNLAEAKLTADSLNAGALPIPLKVIAKDTVEPTLGADTFNQVLLAGIIGIIGVILFMVLYYKLPGVIASIALCLYALFVLAVFKGIHATIDLAGLAAFIISIGMAVDANILIFERLKEELRSGKTLRAAIDAGFGRAFTAIFDSNMCTAITCVILMYFGTPAVQSFALTLLIGVAISMFTAITVTRTILHLMVGWEWAQQPSHFGLSTAWMAKRGLNLDIVGKRAYYFLLSAVLIVPGLIFLSMYQLNPGIEFKSGTELTAQFTHKVTLDDVKKVVDEYAPGSSIQLAKDGTFAFITTDLKRENPEAKNQEERAQAETKYNQTITNLRDKLDSQLNMEKDKDTKKPVFGERSIEPAISSELVSNSILSVLIASLAIVLYLSFRFAIGGFLAGLKYGTCAVIALLHDAAFILGLFAILGKVLHWQVDSLFVTAVLTIIGFSVHDTIVVFDRVRENMRHRLRGESFEQLCNRSILQTLTRSINTSFTVVMTLSMLIAFGGPMLRHFYVALLVGIIVGTYSSIFNATPLLIVWDKFAARTKEPKKVSEGRALVEKPITSPIDTPTVSAVQETSEVEEYEDGSEPKNGSSDASKASRVKKKNKKRF